MNTINEVRKEERLRMKPITRPAKNYQEFPRVYKEIPTTLNFYHFIQD